MQARFVMVGRPRWFEPAPARTGRATVASGCEQPDGDRSHILYRAEGAPSRPHVRRARAARGQTCAPASTSASHPLRGQKSRPLQNPAAVTGRPCYCHGVVLAVLATKIRSNGEGSVATAIKKPYEGFLISEPMVGRGMVIFRDPNGRRMVTTAVRRILTTAETEGREAERERRLMYVETENSVYRLAFLDAAGHSVTAASG